MLLEIINMHGICSQKCTLNILESDLPNILQIVADIDIIMPFPQWQVNFFLSK